tara:strand:- start:930 stop:1670 length:741 start_codon:yes stop_codon:yes gene_type:complete
MNNVVQEYNQILNKLIKRNDTKLFFNHGYYDDNLAVYDQDDMPWKNNINLYFHLLRIVGLNMKDISLLDIGCGLGYGSHLLKKYFGFKKVCAVDINSNSINHAKNLFNDVEYDCQNANKLNYDDNSFDIVYNIESNHCYRDDKNFYKEVKRVLKPNGLYLMTDPFEIMDDLIFEKNIKDVGLYMLEKRNITFFVLGAVLDEINYFNKRHNLDEDVKKFYIDLYKDKKIVYENLHNYYISYVIKKVG